MSTSSHTVWFKVGVETAVIIDFGVTVMVPDTLVESHKTPFVVIE